MHVPKFEVTKNLTITVVLSSVFLGFIGGGYLMFSEFRDLKRSNGLLTEGVSKLNKKNLLQNIVAEKMPSAPIDVVVSTADRIYDLSQLKQVPLHIICGLIEIESGWNPNISSGVGARGLMQIMSATARPYLSSDRMNYDTKILFNPVVNVTVGISLLSDLHAQHNENGFEDTDWTLSLHSFFWGSSNTYSLYGKKDARVNVPNFSYPTRVLEASKFYKKLGL